ELGPDRADPWVAQELRLRKPSPRRLRRLHWRDRLVPSSSGRLLRRPRHCRLLGHALSIAETYKWMLFFLIDHSPGAAVEVERRHVEALDVDQLELTRRQHPLVRVGRSLEAAAERG